MQTVLITGGTGMVGKELTQIFLREGFKVIVLSRKEMQSDVANLSYALWEVENQKIDVNAISQADIIVHLAGEGVADKRWSAKRKKAILDSRVKSGQLLVSSLKNQANKVKTFISASAIGWYGSDTEESLKEGFKEDDPFSTSYLGATCFEWEQSVKPLSSLGIRLVTLRIGIVLSTKGGAMLEFIKPAKYGIASVLGSGQQIISWIHYKDLCKMIQFVATTERIIGIYNAVAPSSITNKKLVVALAKKFHSFYLTIPVPAFLLKIMLGEMSIEILKSTKVSADKIKTEGFIFDYPTIEKALDQLLISDRSS